MGYQAYGTDASERIVGFAERNMEWLENRTDVRYEVEVGDATNFSWKQPIDAVAAEIYLGPPMSQAPAEIKLKTVRQECGAILRGFLQNLSKQIKAETPVVLAIPAWLRPDGSHARLGVDATEFGFRVMKPLDEMAEMGYNDSNRLGCSGLLYARPSQVVAREIIVLRKN